MTTAVMTRRFDPPVSTSNLVQPARDLVLHYARMAYDGEAVDELLERRLASFHHVEHCISLCNGFWALVLAIRSLALPGKTDILMPSFTYRRMADVAAWARLRPRFCEVDPSTLACSAGTMRQALSPEVGLLLAVHPIVNQCDVPGLTALAAETGLPLLFDSVESVFEWAAGGKIGRFGNAECFSLHASKLLNGFEGGYITTNDPALAQRLRTMRDGVDPEAMDSRLNRFHAAMALAGLDEVDEQVARNKRRYETYQRLLASVPGVRLLEFDERQPTSYKTVVVELTADWQRGRAETLDALNGAGVLARAYYHPPLHAKKMAYPHVAADLAVTDLLAERYMLLPCGHHVTEADIVAVVALLEDMSR